jgi:FKBP-type peptidyl-prolyl cis-trans isomerase
MKNKNQKENIRVIVSFIIIVGVVGLVIYAFMNKPEKVDNLKDINNRQISINTDKPIINKEEVNTQKNKMERVSKNGDVLIMNYTGRFVDGKTFDSNVDPKFNHVEPFEFTLGAGMVIKGWDEGLVGMKIGEKKTLTVPPEKGYGPNDRGSIPGNSTLIFDVELVGIK